MVLYLLLWLRTYAALKNHTKKTGLIREILYLHDNLLSFDHGEDPENGWWGGGVGGRGDGGGGCGAVHPDVGSGLEGAGGGRDQQGVAQPTGHFRLQINQSINLDAWSHLFLSKGSCKKNAFLNGRAIKAPSSLMAVEILEHWKKRYFFLFFSP